MKKVLIRFASVAALLLLLAQVSLAQNGNGQGNNSLVGRAIGAFNSGCSGSVGPLNGSEEIVGSCIAGGFITRVLLYRQVNCQQIDCNAVRFAPVGYVDFDCEGNVTNVSCTWP